MKIISILFIILSFTVLSCNHKSEIQNQFSSNCDTLIVKMEKVKGTGMFPAGAGEIHFETKNRFIDFPLEIPENISDVKIGFELFDFKPWKYYQYKKGELDKSIILKDVIAGKIDTLIVPSLKKNSICFLSGKIDGKNIFIVDENINQSFKDDSIRLYKEMDWKTTQDLIKCKYNIYNGEKIISDTTWLNIGHHPFDSTMLLCYVSHHMTANLQIDNNRFQIGLVDNQSSFWFEDPMVAVLSENNFDTDTLLKSDLLKLGENLKLADEYYRIENITNDGSLLTLIKENDFLTKTGTQVGMIAPEFKFKSFNGDTILSRDFKNEKFLLANISNCTRTSYNEYKNLIKQMNGTIKIIGIDYGIRENLGGIMIDIKDEYNQKFYDNYRNAYSSYECLLINKEGRIADKFDIFSWREHLSDYLEKHN